jgi:hypothetical protein
VERVPDVNHYTILLAPAGARRVADRITSMALDVSPGAIVSRPPPS